jgi:hypothetical protein
MWLTSNSSILVTRIQQLHPSYFHEDERWLERKTQDPLPRGLKIAGKKDSRTTAACSTLIGSARHDFHRMGDCNCQRKKNWHMAPSKWAWGDGEKAWGRGFFYARIVASTSARSVPSVGNSRRCSITVVSLSRYAWSQVVSWLKQVNCQDSHPFPFKIYNPFQDLSSLGIGSCGCSLASSNWMVTTQRVGHGFLSLCFFIVKIQFCTHSDWK